MPEQDLLPGGVLPPAPGQTAPDFTLANQFGEEVTLWQLRGRPVVVVFVPFAFTGTCTGELCEIRDNIELFAGLDAEVLVISVDSKFALRAWAQAEGFNFSLLADFWPHGEVAQSYGVFDHAKGMAVRGTFILDAQSVVRYSVVNGPGQARDFGAYREALAALA